MSASSSETERPGGQTPAKQAFVVIGCHRSGTSAMARVLSLAGCRLPARLMAAGVDNPAGFWEAPEIVRLNDELLRLLGSTWDDALACDERSQDLLLTAGNMEVIGSVLRGSFGDAGRIVLKDPRVSMLARVWGAAFAQAGFEPTHVILVRNPLEVAQSLAKRNGFSIGRGLLIWVSYMLAAERDTRDTRRLFVEYGQLTRSPEAVLVRVETASGTRLGHRDEAARGEIRDFLDEGLRHHRRSPADLRADPALWGVVADLHAWFEAAAAGEPLPVAALASAASRFDDVRRATAGVLAEERARVATLATTLRTITKELDAVAVRRAQDDARVQRTLAEARAHIETVEAENRRLNELLAPSLRAG